MEGKSIYYVLKAFLFIIPLCIVQNNSGQLPAGRVTDKAGRSFRQLKIPIAREAFDFDIPSVCAIAPGVLGVTGVETMDIVFGVANKVKPDLIIAVDALASRRAARISTTIQLSDSGISPGSGVGNTRADLSRANLGVPVIAVGVPLVVYASTISQDTISLIADETGLHGDEARLRELAEQVIAKHMGDFIVTPKDIDVIVEDMAGIIANAINSALFGNNLEQVRNMLA